MGDHFDHVATRNWNFLKGTGALRQNYVERNMATLGLFMDAKDLENTMAVLRAEENLDHAVISRLLGSSLIGKTLFQDCALKLD